MERGGSLPTTCIGKTGCNSVDPFLRVILKAPGPVPLQLLWPLLQLLRLLSDRDLLCVLRWVVLRGLLGSCCRGLLLMAGISTLLGPAHLQRRLSLGLPLVGEPSPPASASSVSGDAVQSVLSEPPFFPFFRKLSRRFVPRLDKIQQEWATQGQIRDTRLRPWDGKLVLCSLTHGSSPFFMNYSGQSGFCAFFS